MFAMTGHALSPRAPDEEPVAASSSTVPACVAPTSSPAALPPGTASPSAETRTSRYHRRGPRSRRRPREGPGASESRRDARLAPWHQLAPDNTTDFLMDDHGSAHDSVVFDRYGWPTPRPSSPSCSPPQLEPPPPWSIDDLRSMVSRHVALEHSVERLEERLHVLRRQRPPLVDEEEDDYDEDEDEVCSSSGSGDRDEVRMCPETAAKIRVLQAEISRLESENESLARDNELLAARARQPLVSDPDLTSDSESDSSDSEGCESDSSSSSSSSSSNSTSSSDTSTSSSRSSSTSSSECASLVGGDGSSQQMVVCAGGGGDVAPQQLGVGGVTPQQSGTGDDSGITPQHSGTGDGCGGTDSPVSSDIRASL